MDFAFEFSNVLGGVYTQGNTLFSEDSKCILSPVGNKLTAIDLTGTKTQTAGFESSYDIVAMDFSPKSGVLVIADETGNIFVCSFHHNKVLSTFRIDSAPSCVKFTPDGRKLVVLTKNLAIIYHAPTAERCFNGLDEVWRRSVAHGKSCAVCVDWDKTSSFCLIGSEDGIVRLIPVCPDTKFHQNDFAGVSSKVMGCFFERDSMNFVTVATNGQMRRFETDATFSAMEEIQTKIANGLAKEGFDPDDPKFRISNGRCYINYRRDVKTFLGDMLEGFGHLSCSDFHKRTNLLAIGSLTGSFALLECPGFQIIHSISVSDCAITSLQFNSNGDWVALACKDRGQLLVWDWQSETWVIKQQSHFNNIATCGAYSPDAELIATGGRDGRVKIWSALNGNSLATLTDHKSEITGLVFKNSTYPVVVSCSLDGTVRAYDLSRYRNFRTFTSPRACQFSCVDIDTGGDLIAAGGQTEFDIYLWSLKTGQLLETLTDHSGPVSSLKFVPGNSFRLISCSWDRTMRTWDVMDMKAPREALPLMSEGLCVACHPDGREVAVSTLNAKILFFDSDAGHQTGTIDAKFDVGLARKPGQVATAGKLRFGRAFKAIAYTPDGNYIVAGGKTKFVCIYHVQQRLLVKRITITANESIKGLHEMLDRRRMTRWGNLSLIEKEDEESGQVKDRLKLPGTREMSKSGRVVDREIEVTCVHVSPTGRGWIACTSEGVHIYSTYNSNTFEPFELTVNATPKEVEEDLQLAKYGSALDNALRLNDLALIDRVVLKTPSEAMCLIASEMDIPWMQRFLKFLASQLISTAYIEQYMDWVNSILCNNLTRLKTHSQQIKPILCELQRNIKFRFEQVSRTTESASKMLKYCSTNEKITERFQNNTANPEDTGSKKQWIVKHRPSNRV